MPTADLDAVIRVLPAWVTIGAFVAVPLLLVLTGLFVIWLCARCTRITIDGVHWTEAARRRATSRAILGRQVFLQVFLAFFVTFLLTSGELTNGWLLTRAFAAGFTLWLVSRPIVFAHTCRVHPELTVREFVNGQLLILLFLTIPILAIVMALAGPTWPEASLGWCVAFYAGGVLLMSWLMLRGMVTLARILGLIAPVPERLRSLVTAVERRTGHPIRRVWVLHAPWANAAALPPTNELIVTTRALAAMDDAELTAILLHEVGHLRESRSDQRRRQLGVLPFVVFALWQPLAAGLGTLLTLGIVLLSLVVSMRTNRHARRLEEAADHHAHEHRGDDDPGTYARTLERLHRLALVPAVARSRRTTHPHLYDRMLAAGVQPDYPRPLPPSRRPWLSLAFAVLTLGAMFAALAPRFLARPRMYESETAAFGEVVMTGGDLRSLGAVGYHWIDARSADAATVLAFVANRSSAPEHSAWLAMTLAATDVAAAERCLDHAKDLCERRTNVPPWVLDTIEAAQGRIDAADPSEPR